MTVREILAFDHAAIIFTISGKESAYDNNYVTKLLGASRGFFKPLHVAEQVAAVRADLLARACDPS